MKSQYAIQDYEMLCTLAELEAEIDGCEALVEALESASDPDSCLTAGRLRERASRARIMVRSLCEQTREPKFDA